MSKPGAEVSFRYGKLANFQIQLMRHNPDGPRNRNYISEVEKVLAARERGLGG